METEDVDLDDQSKAVMLFGRDIRKIPCFKNSMLFGAYSSLVTGLGTFMFTSRVKLATNVAVSSYMGVSMVYFFFCRYNYVKNKYAIAEVQQALQQTQRAEIAMEFLEDDQGKLQSA